MTDEQPPTPITIIANHQLPITLTNSNFPIWRTHVRALLIGLDLLGFVDGTITKPHEKLDATVYSAWYRQDQLLLVAILGAVSPDILPLLSTCDSAAAAWDILHRAFASKSRAHVMHIKTTLSKASLGSRPVSEYVNSIKALADELGLIDVAISNDDLTLYIINGLKSSYKEIVRIIYHYPT